MAYRLPQSTRYQILGLKEAGYTVSQIANQLNITRATVYRWLVRNEEEGNVENHPPLPRARLTTRQQDEEIATAHAREPFRRTRTTAEEHGVSMTIVRRRLHEAGTHYRRPAKKILCSDAHKEDRVAFCLQYYNFDFENNIVIFLDEKSFRSDDDGRKILWRKDGERYEEKNIVANRKSGRVGLNYVGWISSMGPGELVEVSGRLTGAQYLEILQEVILPSVHVCYPEATTIYLAHDNCSIHTAHVVKDWVRAQPNIIEIDWPSKSPDITQVTQKAF